MKRFEIWVINFNPSIGAEISKSRPAVIISADEANDILSTVIVAPLTSSVRDWPTRVDTDFENKGGQIALDQLRTIDKSRLSKKIGKLENNEARLICDILITMFRY